MSCSSFRLFSLIFLALCFAAQGFDLKKAIKESSSKNNQEADAIEAQTNEEYSKNAVEIEKQRQIDIKHKEETDKELADLLEEEAKLDRVPPASDSPTWEEVPRAYIYFMDDWFKKNDYRSTSVEDCAIKFPEHVEWAEKDKKAFADYYRNTEYNPLKAQASAAVETSRKHYNELSAQAGHEVSPDKYQTDSLRYGVAQAEGQEAIANEARECEKYNSPDSIYTRALFIEASYRARPKLEEVIEGKVGGMDAVKRALGAKAIVGEIKPGDKPNSCWEKLKDTRVYSELYTDKINQWYLAPLVEKAIKKLKSEGTWFPSRQMYEWARNLDDEREANRNRAVASWLGKIREFTDDEVLRHYNVVRRMKAYDPLYSKFLSNQK